MDPLQNLNSFEKSLVHRARQNHVPISSSIELFPLCNMSCRMCYVRMTKEEMDSKGRMKTASEWLQIGKEMRDCGTLFVLLTGGEPLLYPGFKEVFLGLKEMGMILTVNTNGTLLNDEWVDFFAEHRPRRINVTLYGINEQIYSDLCQYPAGFEKATRGVKKLRERDIDVLLSTSLTPQNIDHLEEYIDLARDLNCSVTFDDYMMPAQRERDLPYPIQSRVLPESAANARIRFIRKTYGQEKLTAYAKQIINEIEERATTKNPIGDSGFTCMASSCSYTINWQGNMRPCTMLHTPSFSVTEHGISGAWKKLTECCSSIKLNKECAACKLKPLCRTCVAGALLETGDFSGKANYMCSYSEELYRLYKREVYENGI